MGLNRKMIINFIEEFLTLNGWIKDTNDDSVHYQIFNKPDNLSIDICDKEIVFIADEGDVCHLPINSNTYYAVIGYMVSKRLIACDFKESGCK